MLPKNIKILLFSGLSASLFPLIIFCFFLFDTWWNHVQALERENVLSLSQSYTQILKTELGKNPLLSLSLSQTTEEGTASAKSIAEKDTSSYKTNVAFPKLFILLPKTDTAIITDPDNNFIYSNETRLKTIKDNKTLESIFTSLPENEIKLFETKIDTLSQSPQIAAGTFLKAEGLKFVLFRETNKIFAPIQTSQNYFWLVLISTLIFAAVYISYLIKKLLFFVK